MSTEDPTATGGTLLDNPNAGNGGQPEGGKPKAGEPTGGGKSESWITEHLDGVEGAEKLSKFNGVAALAKGYLNLESLQGASVRIPKDDATIEEQNKFYEKLGRPPSPEGYELLVSEDPGQTAEDATAFKAQIHKLGLTKKQARQFWDWSREYGRQRIKTLRQAVQVKEQQALAPLQTEWGSEYAMNVGKATTVIQRFGGAEALQFMQNTRIGANPIILRMLVNIGKAMSEDVLKGGTLLPLVEAEQADGLFEYSKSPKLK